MDLADPFLSLMAPVQSAVRTVVVLNDFCHVQGGASKVALEEAIGLRQFGMQVIFVGAVGPVDPRLAEAGVVVACLEGAALSGAMGPTAAWHAIWNRPAFRRVESLLRGCDPQSTIVHLHGYTKALSVAPVVAADRLGFPVVCTLHDFFLACPNGAFYDYRAGAICHRESLSLACLGRNCDKRHGLHKAYRVARSAVQRHVSRVPARITAFISLSDTSARVLAPYLPPDRPVFPLENIIEIPYAARVDVARHRTLVVVGRLEQEKGVELAAEAACRSGLDLLFVGDGPLRRHVERRGARVTGWLGAAGVGAALEQARCLVFPSLWYEAYGLVVSEAAARGIPAIVSDVSAPAERVQDGVTGWHFRSGDMDSLLAALRHAGDDAAIDAAGAAAFTRYWADAPTPMRHTAELLLIYNAILQGLPAAA